MEGTLGGITHRKKKRKQGRRLLPVLGCLLLLLFLNVLDVRAEEDSGFQLVNPVTSPETESVEGTRTTSTIDDGKGSVLWSTASVTDREDSAAETAETDSMNVSGIYTDKTLTELGGGKYRIRLEQYVTGEAQPSETVEEPADLVILLDYSESMSGRAIEEMNQAVSEFVARIAAYNEEEEESRKTRVAVVDYGGNNQESDAVKVIRPLQVLKLSEVEELQSRIQAQRETLGNTWTDAAMNKAASLLSGSTGRRKVILLVTDGYPYHEAYGVHNSGDSDQDRQAVTAIGGSGDSMLTLSAANAVLGSAKRLKEDGTKIFCCYISNDGNDEQYLSCGSLAEMEDTMVSFGYKFLYMVSSANPHASHILNPTVYQEGVSDASGSTDPAYLKTSGTLEEMAEMFRNTYADVMTGMTGDYREGMTAKDWITEPFELCAAKEPEKTVRTYVSERLRLADGSFGWSAGIEREGLYIYTESNRVEVNGFDFYENAVTEEPKEGTGADYGRKLIIEFDIQMRDSFGGIGVNTNELRSGLYNSSRKVAAYPVPETDLPLQYAVIGQDRTVYLPESSGAAELVSEDYTGVLEEAANGRIFEKDHVPDGKNNAFVDLEYELLDEDGNRIGSMSIPHGTAWEYDLNERKGNIAWSFAEGAEELTGGSYTLRCSVIPVAVSGAVYSSADAEPLILEKTLTLYVFYPEIEARDTRQRGPYTMNGIDFNGDVLDFEPGISSLPASSGISAHCNGFHWLCDQEGAVRRDPEPGLYWDPEPQYGTEYNGMVWLITAEDGSSIPVKTEVSRIIDGERKMIPDEKICWQHSCSVLSDCDFAERTKEGVHFLIHVTAPSVPELYKEAVSAVVEPGDPVCYQITVENTSDRKQTFTLTDLIPKNGDGIGSSFNGKLILSEVNVDLSSAPSLTENKIALELTRDAAIREEEQTLREQITDWSAVSGNRSGDNLVFTPAAEEWEGFRLQLTAEKTERIVIAVQLRVLDEDLQKTLYVMQGGDRYVNRALVSADGQQEESDPIPVHVINRKISGLVFADDNNDGLRNTDEEKISGVRVKLCRLADPQETVLFTLGEAAFAAVYDTNGNRVTDRWTDAEGAYEYENLQPDHYYVFFSEMDQEKLPAGKNVGEDETLDSDAEEEMTPGHEAVIWNLDLENSSVLQHKDLGLIQQKGKLEIEKTADSQPSAFGESCFLFRLSDEQGNHWTRQIRTSKDSGSGTAVIDELPLGIYYLEEIPVLHYSNTLVSCSENAVSEGNRIRIALTADEPLCKVIFTNELTDAGKFTHNDLKLNRTYTNTPVQMEVTYLGENPISSEESSYTFPPGSVEAVILYDTGETATILYDGSNLTLSPAVLASSDNTGKTPYTVAVYYSERGVTLKDTFEVSVDLKAERRYQVIYHPEGGAFMGTEDTNTVRYRYADGNTEVIAGRYLQPERESCSFAGWSSLPGSLGTYYADGEELTVMGEGAEERYDLYACWNVPVTLIAGEGTIDGTQQSQVVEEHLLGRAVGTGRTAVCEGYVFDGWNTQADGNGTWMEDYGNLNSAETFYAVYHEDLVEKVLYIPTAFSVYLSTDYENESATFTGTYDPSDGSYSFTKTWQNYGDRVTFPMSVENTGSFTAGGKVIPTGLKLVSGFADKGYTTRTMEWDYLTGIDTAIQSGRNSTYDAFSVTVTAYETITEKIPSALVH